MRSHIANSGHNKSGKLSQSISFNVTFKNDKLDLGLKAKEYLLYLDDGKFVQDFFEKREVLDLLAEFIGDDLLKF